MSITTRTTKLAAGSLALAAAAVLPLTGATPAQAATTQDGCTITVHDAEFRGTFNPAALPYVFYPIEISCVASATGLSVAVSVQTWEQDLKGRPGDVDANGINNADEDRIGSAGFTRTFGPAGGTKTVDVRGVVSTTDTDNNDEVYAAASLQVTSGPVTGAWSSLELAQNATRINW